MITNEAHRCIARRPVPAQCTGGSQLEVVECSCGGHSIDTETQRDRPQEYVGTSSSNQKSTISTSTRLLVAIDVGRFLDHISYFRIAPPSICVLTFRVLAMPAAVRFYYFVVINCSICWVGIGWPKTRRHLLNVPLPCLRGTTTVLSL